MSGNNFLKSHVVSCQRKVYSDWEDVRPTSSGRAFQASDWESTVWISAEYVGFIGTSWPLSSSIKFPDFSSCSMIDKNDARDFFATGPRSICIEMQDAHTAKATFPLPIRSTRLTRSPKFHDQARPIKLYTTCSRPSRLVYGWVTIGYWLSRGRVDRVLIGKKLLSRPH